VHRLVVDRQGRHLYALSEDDETVTKLIINRNNGALTAVDPPAPVATSAGRSPLSLALHPATSRVHVTNFGSDTISRLDIADDGAVPFSEESAAHNGPSDISIDREGGFAYVANENEGTVTSYDVSEGGFEERDRVTVGSRPFGIALYEVLMGIVPTP
jgi:DNA-binding beta-propeller fold protein YncE